MSDAHDNMTAAEQADRALGWALETLQAQLEIDINNAWRSKNKPGIHQKIYHLRVVSAECAKARRALRQSAQLDWMLSSEDPAPEDL